MFIIDVPKEKDYKPLAQGTGEKNHWHNNRQINHNNRNRGQVKESMQRERR